jgi:uncharacterized membrane protein YccC
MLRRWTARVLPLDSAGFNLAAGIRAAIAVATPVLLGEYFGRPELSWVAIVAFWGCLADSGGAWRDRFSLLALFILLMLVGTTLGMLAEPHLALAVALAFVWCFAMSFIRVFGAAATSLGVLGATDILVTLGIPAGPHGEALERLGLTLVGGAWAMLLVLIVWRLHPHGPARRAVGQCWQALGAYADGLGRLERPGQGAPAEWATVMRTHRSATRAALEEARGVVTQARRQTGGRAARGQSLMLLLIEVERCFEILVALSEMLQVAHEVLTPDAERGIAAILRRVARESDLLAGSLRDSKPLRARNLAPLLDRLGHRLGRDSPLAAPIQRLAGDLIRAVEAARDISGGVRAPERLAEALTVQPAAVSLADLVRTARDNFGWDSLYFRHALRLALTVAVAEGLVSWLELPRGYWLTMTAAVTLQPFLATTWRRTLERVSGSVLGGIVAALLSVYVTDPLWISALVVPLSIATLAVRSVNYTLFVLCLTPEFILIAELFQPGGMGSWDLAALRGLDSIIGGLLGLAAAFLLWPAREALILRRRLAAAVSGNRRFLAAVLAGSPDPEAVQAARRAAGLASNNAEASIQRLVGEPRRRSDPLLEPSMSIVTSCRRVGGGGAALIAIRETGGQPLAARRTIAWANASLKAIAEAIEQGREVTIPDRPAEALGADPASHELGQIIRQIEPLAEAANRLAAGEPGGETADAVVDVA